MACLDIEFIRPTAINGQAVTNLLANFPRINYFSLPQQEVLVTEEQKWSMHFDDSSTFPGGGIGVVLKSLGEEHLFAYKLHFPYSNNEAEYEFLLVGLKAAERLGIKKLKVFRDSELVIKQVGGTYGVKNPSLATYRATVQKLMKHFTSIECKVISKWRNYLVWSKMSCASLKISENPC